MHQYRRAAVQAALILRERADRRNAKSLEGLQVGRMDKIHATVTIQNLNRGALLPDNSLFVVYSSSRSAIVTTVFLYSGNFTPQGN